MGANANIVSFAFSLSGALGAALGGSVVTNNIQDTTEAYLTGTAGSPTVISQAGSVTVEAVSNEAAAGAALGVNIGSVAAGASVVTSNIGGSTIAYVDNYVQIGQAAGQTVGSLTVEATAGATIVSSVWGPFRRHRRPHRTTKPTRRRTLPLKPTRESIRSRSRATWW